MAASGFALLTKQYLYNYNNKYNNIRIWIDVFIRFWYYKWILSCYFYLKTYRYVDWTNKNLSSRDSGIENGKANANFLLFTCNKFSWGG